MESGTDGGFGSVPFGGWDRLLSWVGPCSAAAVAFDLHSWPPASSHFTYLASRSRPKPRVHPISTPNRSVASVFAAFSRSKSPPFVSTGRCRGPRYKTSPLPRSARHSAHSHLSRQQGKQLPVWNTLLATLRLASEHQVSHSLSRDGAPATHRSEDAPQISLHCSTQLSSSLVGVILQASFRRLVWFLRPYALPSLCPPCLVSTHHPPPISPRFAALTLCF